MASSRWLSLWQHAHAKAGGWAGPATLEALRPLAEGLADLGLTTRQAGAVTALAYRWHRAAEDRDEALGGSGVPPSEAGLSAAAARLGASRSPAKAAAARANGRKGGRPKKTKARVSPGLSNPSTPEE
jgi:hypothetical protein